MSQQTDCIFCQIVSGNAPSFRVCEDELTLTFMDIFPVSPGHTLVISKEHHDNVFEMPAVLMEAVARATRQVALAIRAELEPEGLGLHQLNGAAAGQTVFHYHQHLIPRSAGEVLALHTRIRGDDRELLEMANRLAQALRSDSGP